MKLTAVFLVFIFSFANASGVKTAKAPAENISSVYIKMLSDETAEIKIFQKKFKASPKSFCPHYTGPDESTCFKIFLQSYQVKSSNQAMLMTTVAASMGVNDTKVGYSAQMTRILMLENVIVLYENLKMSNFYLAQMQPATAEGKMELKLLKNSDEQLLTGSFQKMEAVLQKGLSTVEKNRSVASVEEWKKKKIGELRTRLEKLKKINWKYPT